jgi:hypothetical protein
MKPIKSVCAIFMIVMVLTFISACGKNSFLSPSKAEDDNCVKHCEQKFKGKGSPRALENCIRNCKRK